MGCLSALEHSVQRVPTVWREVCHSRRAAGSNLNLWPPAGFWGSDVHCQRSQLPLCLPQRLPSSSTFHHSLYLALFTSESLRALPLPLPPPLLLFFYADITCVSHLSHMLMFRGQIQFQDVIQLTPKNYICLIFSAAHLRLKWKFRQFCFANH